MSDGPQHLSFFLPLRFILIFCMEIGLAKHRFGCLLSLGYGSWGMVKSKGAGFGLHVLD